MNIFQSIVLGLIQGLTEFLPISSSGHLVLGSKIFGLTSENIIFEVFLHYATFMAVLVFFFHEVVDLIRSPIKVILKSSHIDRDLANSRYLLLIIIGTIPAAVLGLLFKDKIEAAFNSPLLVGIMLLVTSLILFLTLFSKPIRLKLRLPDCIVIGIAQAVAMLPGVSRSGATISSGMYLGIDKKTAFNFSFLLSLPAIFGAFLLELKDAVSLSLPSDQVLIYIAGMIAAFISGYLCLVILRKIVIAGKFAYFGIYTLIIGILTIVFRSWIESGL
jgi:undecaprenyl-diphosphatase